MSNISDIEFIAQNRRGSIVFFPIVLLIPGTVLICLLFVEPSNGFLAKLICAIICVVLGVGLFLFGIHYYWHKIIISEDRITLKRVFGDVIRNISKADIIRIDYRAGYNRSMVPYLIIVDKQCENANIDMIVNKKGEYIKIDINAKRLKTIQDFWQKEIINLPKS